MLVAQPNSDWGLVNQLIYLFPQFFPLIHSTAVFCQFKLSPLIIKIINNLLPHPTPIKHHLNSFVSSHIIGLCKNITIHFLLKNFEFFIFVYRVHEFPSFVYRPICLLPSSPLSFPARPPLVHYGPVALIRQGHSE